MVEAVSVAAMGITVADQTLTFLWSVGFGAALGVLYDLFRVLRVAFPAGRVMAFVQDMLWWLGAAALTLLFLVARTDGALRGFVLVGEICGFALYQATIGAAVMVAVRWLSQLIGRILRVMLRPFAWVFRKSRRFAARNWTKSRSFLKKGAKRVKYSLKKRGVLLYNLYNPSGAHMDHTSDTRLPEDE